MDETDLLLQALSASPANAELAAVLERRLETQERWPELRAALQTHCLGQVSAQQLAAAELTLNRLLDRFPNHPTDALRQAFAAQDVTPRRWQMQRADAVPTLPQGHALDRLSAFSPLKLKPGESGVGFADVGGMQALKQVVQMKVIQPLLQPELFKRYGQTAGGGVLMYGPPGCGKTYFAKAIAGECGACFFNVGIQDILNMYLGNSERNIHQLFEAARASKPAIIFIDEIDALGRKRELLRHSGITSTINAFLAEMDGAGAANEQVLILGATNAPWDIDSAFKRPGRFDHLVFVPPPDLEARCAILELHLSKTPTAGDVDSRVLAQQTPNFSGADLASLVNRAATAVLQEVLAGAPERPLTMVDLMQALSSQQASTQAWLTTAKQYVEFANNDGDYSDVAAFLKQTKAWHWPGF